MKAGWISFLLTVASLSPRWAQEDLQGRSFIFGPKGYVVLESDQVSGEPFENVTVCLKYFTDSMGHQALFSYATKDQNRDILIHTMTQNPYRWYNVFIGGTDVSFRAPYDYMSWQSICITWVSETGVITFWLQRVPLSRKIVRKGYSIRTHSVIQLGRAHREDTFFSGEIQQVYMWNYTVQATELRYSNWSMTYPSPVISWRNLEYETRGNVELEYVI